MATKTETETKAKVAYLPTALSASLPLRGGTRARGQLEHAADWHGHSVSAFERRQLDHDQSQHRVGTNLHFEIKGERTAQQYLSKVSMSEV